MVRQEKIFVGSTVVGSTEKFLTENTMFILYLPLGIDVNESSLISSRAFVREPFFDIYQSSCKTAVLILLSCISALLVKARSFTSLTVCWVSLSCFLSLDASSRASAASLLSSAASLLADDACCVVESSCLVNLSFSRPVISVTRICPHVSSAKPITSINQPTWSSLCAHLGICGSGRLLHIIESFFLLNHEIVQIDASAPSIITPIITNTNPSNESADQRLNDVESSALIQKSCQIQRIVGYGTLSAILLSLMFSFFLATLRKFKK